MASKLIIGIETSCDETAVAIVKDGKEVLSNVIASQIEWHKIFGGVVPEVASRKHVEYIDLVIKRAIKEAGILYSDLDGVAVTHGPGLVGSLLVGLVAAKSLAWSLNLPLIGVNHIMGHIYANVLDHGHIKLPLICLTVSGGHTDLLYMEEWGHYEILGRTQDDAAGEAFDKVARFLGLAYPGGPEIDALAKKGDSTRYEFPHSQMQNPYDYSFSGLKTAVINLVHNLKQKELSFSKADLAASFQETIIESLLGPVIKAAEAYQVETVLLSGGVAANSLLRARLTSNLLARGIDFYYPSLEYCTDNGAMIACAGYYLLEAGQRSSLLLEADPRLVL